MSRAGADPDAPKLDDSCELSRLRTVDAPVGSARRTRAFAHPSRDSAEARTSSVRTPAVLPGPPWARSPRRAPSSEGKRFNGVAGSSILS